MSNSSSGSRVVKGLFKFIGTIISIVILLAVGGYCYLRFAKGIDLIDIKKKMDLLNADYNESEIINNTYSNDDVVSGLQSMFGTNDIYTQDENGNYTFNLNQYIASSLTNGASLSDKQFCAVANVFLKSAVNSTEYNLEDYLSVKQVDFNTLTKLEDSTSVNMDVIARIDFTDIKNEAGSFFGNFIPDKVYLTINITVNIADATPDQFTYTCGDVIINKLTAEQSKSILTTINNLLSSNAVNTNDMAKSAMEALFGSDTKDGFVNSITGCGSFEFRDLDGKICIVLKTA